MNQMRVRRIFNGGFMFILPALIVAGCSNGQMTFHSPEIAVKSLVAAVRSDEPQRLKTIFGSGSGDLVQSGDTVADRNARQRFVQAFERHHELVEMDDGSLVLIVGDKDWPFPVPIVQKSRNEWIFDTPAGRDEIIARRIGRNETSALEVCRAIVDAQREYVAQDHDGNGTLEYAQKFMSDQGKRNGLYWPTEPGEPPSPLGPLVAEATAEGYTAPRPGSGPQPYHGYYYRILKSQGPHASGGALDYVVGDRMIAGFAVIAYPAQYDKSGVMSFIVNQDGVVYQRNLGPATAQLARTMVAFDPGREWTKVE